MGSRHLLQYFLAFLPAPQWPAPHFTYAAPEVHVERWHGVIQEMLKRHAAGRDSAASRNDNQRLEK